MAALEAYPPEGDYENGYSSWPEALLRPGQEIQSKESSDVR